jgi:hypothetical protein
LIVLLFQISTAFEFFNRRIYNPENVKLPALLLKAIIPDIRSVTLLLTIFTDSVRRIKSILIFNGQEEPEGQKFIFKISYYHPGIIIRRYPLTRLSDRLLYY